MFFRPSFVTLFFALLALGTPVRRDGVEVESDFQTLAEQSQSLETAIASFPNSGGTFSEVIAIHDSAEGVDKTVKGTTSDANGSGNFTEEETNAVFSIIEEKIVPVIKSGIDQLVTKKSALASMHAQSIAKSDLETLKYDVMELGAAVVAKSSADMKSKVQVQFNTVDAAFASAIKAFSTD